MGELAYELEGEAGELVLLDELVQIHGEQFERDTNVIAEGEGLIAVDIVVRVFLVLLA